MDLGTQRLEDMSTYADYQHHMLFMRAALNRVLNTTEMLSLDEYGGPKMITADQRTRIESAVLRCYSMQKMAGEKMIEDMRKYLSTNNIDGDILNVGMRMMNKFNRSTIRVSVIFEHDVHGPRSHGATESKEGQEVNPHALTWRHDYDNYIALVEQRADATKTKFKDEPDLYNVSSLSYVIVSVPSCVKMEVDEYTVWGVFPTSTKGVYKVVIKRDLLKSRKPNTVFLWDVDMNCVKI